MTTLLDRVPAGQPVLLQLANSLDFPIWFLASLAADLPVFPISPTVPPCEIARLAGRTGARWIVTNAPIGPSLAPLPIPPLDSPPLSPRPIAPGLLLTSSGTTSTPKVVHRSTHAIDTVAHNMVEALELTRRDHTLAAVPLSHSYGLEHGLLAPLWAGATAHVVAGMGPGFFDSIPPRTITVMPAVPAMVELLSDSSSNPAWMNALRLGYSAGAPLPAAVRERFTARFAQQIGQIYGMTEIGSVTFNNPHSPLFDPSTVGLPMRDVSFRVVDPSTRQTLPVGTEGELLVSAPSMLSRYIGDPTPTEHAHFITGDLGKVDQHGHITITGRRKLLIDTGGLKVNPLEVEEVLRAHPAVADCAVVAMRQSETVDRLRAIIVPRDPSKPPTERSLREFTRERLAAGKVPRIIELRASLPRTASGKVERTALEER